MPWSEELVSDISDVRWIFFDLGNTLINEERAIKDRIQQMASAFAERSMRASTETIRPAFQEASAEFAPRPIVRVAERLASSLSDRSFVLQRAEYHKELEEPYPEAHEVLSRLALHYGIGAIADQSAGTDMRLESYGLASFISICVSSVEAGLEKPNPVIFQRALERLESEPSEAVMIGDRMDNDVRPAKTLGWRTIRILQGFAKAQVPRNSAEEPDYTVENLAGISALFC